MIIVIFQHAIIQLQDEGVKVRVTEIATIDATLYLSDQLFYKLFSVFLIIPERFIYLQFAGMNVSKTRANLAYHCPY